jgi:integrase/recombinase XerD
MCCKACGKWGFTDMKGTIRQSVITNLLKQGHDLSIVQSFAGHKYPSATQGYKQNEFETLKAEVNKYHPFG